MIDLDSIKNLTYDITPENLKNASKIYTVADIVQLDSNPLAMEISEARGKIGEFASSSIAKGNESMQKAITTLHSAFTALDIIDKTTRAYRFAKPAVKLAVNIGGMWLNFANAGEIAQDVLQLSIRDTIEKGRDLLNSTLMTILNTPVLISLRGQDTTVLDEVLSLSDEIKSRIADYVLGFNMEDFLTLVRMANSDLTIREEKTEYDFTYKYRLGGEFLGVQEIDGVVYLTRNNGVEKITLESNEVIVDKEVYGFRRIGDFNYTATKENTIEKDGTPIGSFSGDFLEFIEYSDKVLLVTTEKIYYSDSLTVKYTGDIKYAITEGEKVIVIDDNKIYQLDTINEPPAEIASISEGEINSIGCHDDSVFFTHKIGNKVELKKIVNEREFEEIPFPDTGFSFYKKASNGKVYGVKGSSLIEIKEEGGGLITEVLTTRLSGDVSDIDIVSINGSNYFLAPAGPSVFVAKEGYLNSWTEKVINFEELGIKEGLISSVIVDGGEVYLASLKNILKVSNNNSLIAVVKYDDTDELSWDLESSHPFPTITTEEEPLGIISIGSIVTADNIVYKMLTKDIYSSGRKIYNNSTKEIESDRNIYSFIKKEDRYYYSDSNIIQENDTALRNLVIKGNVLGYAEINGSVYIFSEEHYYKETGKSSYVRAIETEFEIRTNTRLLSGEGALLAYDKLRVFNYIEDNKKVDNIIQVFNKEILKIINTDKNSFAITEDAIHSLGFNNKMSVDSEYANGYRVDNHFTKGLGIAPFDTKSNILIHTLTDKEEYLGSQSDIFIKHFKTLMKEIPNSVLKVIEDEIIEDILEEGSYDSTEERDIAKFIKDYLITTITSTFNTLMENSFSLSIEDHELFADKLIKRLLPRGSTNVTREFYFVAMEFVKTALEQAVYDMISLDVFGISWEYYNRHKYEWGADINAGINTSYITLSEYSHILDTELDDELKNEYDTLFNTTIRGEIESFINGKTGPISAEDKDSLKAIFTSKQLPDIKELPSFEIWVNSITEASGTHYKPKQQNKYEDIIDESSMDPIQWNELPETISRETFTRLLTLLLNRVKEEMKYGINILIDQDGVPCYSCVNANVVYKGVILDFERQMGMARSMAVGQVINASSYESISTNFYVPSSLNTEVVLKTVLDKQTDLYKGYLMPFIDAVIDASEEVYDEEVPV